jgi:hypothetical protein
MSMIDIRGIPKALLLLHLYRASHPVGTGVVKIRPGYSINDALDDISLRIAVKPIGDALYIDYLHGHLIKCDIGGDEMETALFDREYGAGAGSAVVADARAYIQREYPAFHDLREAKERLKS